MAKKKKVKKTSKAASLVGGKNPTTKTKKKAKVTKPKAKPKTKAEVLIQTPPEPEAVNKKFTEEELGMEQEFRMLVKRTGGLRKGLSPEAIAYAEQLKEALKRKEFKWNPEMQIPGYPNEQIS
jgi:hypothetical protein